MTPSRLSTGILHYFKVATFPPPESTLRVSLLIGALFILIGLQTVRADATPSANPGADPGQHEIYPDSLRPMTLRYRTTMQVGGQSIDLEVQRNVHTAEFEGVPVWRMIEQFVMPPQFGGTASVDTFDVDRETLAPVRRHAQSLGKMEFRYSDGRITGAITGGGQHIPVDLDVSDEIVGDGPGFEMALAAMPLAPGFETTVRFFNPIQQNIATVDLAVESQETVEVSAGTFETLRVEITPVAGEPGSARTLFVTRGAPHIVVRSEEVLPPAMGGGTMVSELTWID